MTPGNDEIRFGAFATSPVTVRAACRFCIAGDGIDKYRVDHHGGLGMGVHTVATDGRG